MPRGRKPNGTARKLATPQSVNAEIEARGYDLKAVNPHAKSVEDTRTPEELLDLIEAKGREVSAAIAELRRLRAT